MIKVISKVQSEAQAKFLVFERSNFSKNIYCKISTFQMEYSRNNLRYR